MSTLGNVIWFLFGGLIWGLTMCFVGLLCCVTIIGIPFGLQCFKIAKLVFFPFGMEVRTKVTSGGGAVLGNVLWVLIVGLWSGIGMFFTGLLYCVTIIGIPFGLQYFKIAQLVIFPFGKEIVPKGMPYYNANQYNQYNQYNTYPNNSQGQRMSQQPNQLMYQQTGNQPMYQQPGQQYGNQPVQQPTMDKSI